MSFALTKVEPWKFGTVEQPDVKLTDFLGAHFGQGWRDSTLQSVHDYSDLWLESRPSQFLGIDLTMGKLMDPEEANRLYGIPGQLEFNSPTYDGAAATMRRRKDREIEREFLMSGRGGFMRFGAGMATQMVATMANPVDFATMFIPVVGSSAKAAQLAKAGRGTLRQALARGLLTEETLRRRVPAPRIVESIIEGTVGQAAVEIPVLAARLQEQANYTTLDAAFNVAAGGVFAVGFRAAMDGAAAVLRRVSAETRARMADKAANDFLGGRDGEDLADFVFVDENIIRQRVVQDRFAARQAATTVVDANIGKIRDRVQKEQAAGGFGPAPGRVEEGIVNAAVAMPDGTVHTGMSYEEIARLPGVGDLSKGQQGFMTTFGRFVSKEEAGVMTRMDPEGRGRVEPEDFDTLGFTDAEREASLRKRLGARKGAEDVVLNRMLALERLNAVNTHNVTAHPEIQAAISRERRRRIDQWAARRETRRKFARQTADPNGNAPWSPDLTRWSDAQAAQVRQRLRKVPPAETRPDTEASILAELEQDIQTLQTDVGRVSGSRAMARAMEKSTSKDFSNDAREYGLGLTSLEGLADLVLAGRLAKEQSAAARQAGDLDEMTKVVFRKQYLDEALQAAIGEGGSAKEILRTRPDAEFPFSREDIDQALEMYAGLDEAEMRMLREHQRAAPEAVQAAVDCLIERADLIT